MYNQPFLFPRYLSTPNIIRNSLIPASANINRMSLFGRLGNIFQGIKNFNWSGLINNTSKTLGIINQSIPLVKQVGPMVGNVKSMIKLASVFKDETDDNHQKQSINNYRKKEPTTNNNINLDSPTFFIN